MRRNDALLAICLIALITLIESHHIEIDVDPEPAIAPKVQVYTSGHAPERDPEPQQSAGLIVIGATASAGSMRTTTMPLKPEDLNDGALTLQQRLADSYLSSKGPTAPSR